MTERMAQFPRLKLPTTPFPVSSASWSTPPTPTLPGLPEVFPAGSHWPSLFFFPFWDRLSADIADELFRAHQRPWGFIRLQEYSSFKSSEVINAKAREPINLIYYHQSRTTKKSKGKRVKTITRGSETFTFKRITKRSMLKCRFRPTVVNTAGEGPGKSKASGPSPPTHIHIRFYTEQHNIDIHNKGK